MMRLTAVALGAALVAAASVSGQCDDPYDGVLCVDALDAAEAAQFSAADGQVSAFWGDWTGKDYLELVPPTNCYPGKCGFVGEAADASLSVKAAATGLGLYVYAVVQDNAWVDPASTDDLGADAVDLYFDKLSANTIFTCTDCLIGLYESTLSATTWQLQVWMGATALPTTLRFAYYDPVLWTWTTTTPTFAAAKAQSGIETEVIQVDATHKGQEWFIPWSKYCGGFAEGTVLDGVRLGFAGGYNDKDGDNAVEDMLRWANGKDPWAADAKTSNAWGDLLIGPGVTVPVLEPRAGAAGHAMASQRVVKSEYFDLKGAKLDAGAILSLAPSALVIKRALFADGSQASQMVRIGR